MNPMNLNAQFNNNALGQAAYIGSGGGQAEPSRPIANAMTELAVAQGELETAARALVSRISALIPGGSPFDAQDRSEASVKQAAIGGTPIAVTSQFVGDLNARIWGLRQITERLNEAARGIEI